MITELDGIFNSLIDSKTHFAVGLDKMNIDTFKKRKNEEINIIMRKFLKGNYKFTPYRQLVVSKGTNSLPRIISIPTIRDRITLKYIEINIKNHFPHVSLRIPQAVVSKLKKDILYNEYSYFIKIDIKSFYDSINHRKLKKKLQGQGQMSKLLTSNIMSAISNGTKNFNTKNTFTKKIGVPQGISISNILAEVYLNELDLSIQKKDVAYYRFVDDIIVLSNSKIKLWLLGIGIVFKFRLLSLRLNKKKSSIIPRRLNFGFDYLGYSFNDKQVSVRKTNVLKIEKRIESLFSKYSRKLTEINSLSAYTNDYHRTLSKFKWKLFLLVYGGMLEESKPFGWVTYFLKMNNVAQLYKLDWLINRMFTERFAINIDEFKKCEISIVPNDTIPSFVDSYFSLLKGGFDNSSTIIKIYDWSETLIKDYCYYIIGLSKKQINKLDKVNLSDVFKKNIFQELSSLERDIVSS